MDIIGHGHHITGRHTTHIIHLTTGEAGTITVTYTTTATTAQSTMATAT